MEPNYFRSRTPEELAQFYSDLFVLDVEIKKEGEFSLEEASAFVVSFYKNQNGDLIGAMILDIAAAASFSGALSDLPEDLIQGIVQSSEFTKEMWEDLYEVLNISSQLFTSYNGNTISIEEVYHHPNTLPKEVYEILLGSTEPLIFTISISEYGGGVITVIDAQNNSFFANENTQDYQAATQQDFANYDDVEAQNDADKKEKVNQFYLESPLSEPDETFQTQAPQSGNSSRPPWLYLFIGLGLGSLIGAGAIKLLDPDISSGNQANGLINTLNDYSGPSSIKQVLIPKSKFTMGCTREFSEECGADEFPSHTVSLPNDYYIMKSEVTQEQYESITGKNPSIFKDCGLNCPVENVSWKDAVAFANQLSEHHSLETCYHTQKDAVTLIKGTDCLGYRLPTEAEWEYAARGKSGLSKVPPTRRTQLPSKKGLAIDITRYSGSNKAGETAWYGGYAQIKEDNLGRVVGIGKSTVHPICKKAPNDFGLCDMSGNVWEWTEDTYLDNFYSFRSARLNPIAYSKGASRVLRGGSWLSSELELRTSQRFYASENTIDSLVPSLGSFGFRLVRTAPKVKNLPSPENMLQPASSNKQPNLSSKENQSQPTIPLSD